MKKENKMVAEVELNQLVPTVLGIIVFAVVAAFGLNILSDIKGDFTAGSAEANATSDAISGIAKFTTKLPLIVTIIVAAIIITLLVRNLSFQR